ncbi:MAG: hypothetical protein NUV84_00420 [Candidatus Uhrbacteria bacterium]|nr:hypothetical protein [Candidatus Uhrbacteria bacterium]
MPLVRETSPEPAPSPAPESDAVPASSSPSAEAAPVAPAPEAEPAPAVAPPDAAPASAPTAPEAAPAPKPKKRGKSPAKKEPPVAAPAPAPAVDTPNSDPELKPEEAAPAEPTPDVVPAEPATEDAPAPEAAPTSEAAPEKSFMRRAYERFVSKFRGEAQPEDNKEYVATGTDFVKALAMGALSVVATYTGVKVVADLPPWFYQKFFTNRAERKRIKDALAEKEAELDETGVLTAIDQKKAALEEAINASKFLTKEKKAELLDKLHGIVDVYKGKGIKYRDERNQRIAELINKTIETRVKNTQVLKEGFNSALMITGLAAMRGVAYGVVASFERYKQVAKERAEGKRTGGQFKEWIVKGFTETAHNLIGGKADTWTGKGMNFVKGASNVLRAAGFADIAIAEYMEEGGPSKMIEASFKAWEEKGTVGFLEDNFETSWQRLGHLGEYAKTIVTGSEPTPGAIPETPDGSGAAGVQASPEAASVAGSPEAAAAASGAAGAAGVVAAESAPSVEGPETQIEAGLVKKGDGIVEILERNGGVSLRSAIQAAKEAGIIRSGGDTRLTTEAISRLSVFAETQPDGDIEIKFFDSETDKVLTLAQAREAGLTYEHGTVPGEIPTEKEIVSYAAEPNPNAETPVHGQDSPNVPNQLLNETFKIETDKDGNFIDVDCGDGNPLLRINAALAELKTAGHEDSAEAHYLDETYKKVYNLLFPGSTGAEALPDTSGDPDGSPAIEPEASTDTEPLRKFKGEAGRIKFIYDKATGAVKDAFMPAYTPGRRDIEASLHDWGLTIKQVKEHFYKGTSLTHMDGTLIDTSHPGRYPGLERTGFPIQSPENDYRQFVRSAERLTRQEALLNDMADHGYARTPEYDRLKMETEKLETYVAENMTRQFQIKERAI